MPTISSDDALSKEPELNHAVRTHTPDHRRGRLGAVDLRRTTAAHRSGDRAGTGQRRCLRYDHDDEFRGRVRSRAHLGLHRRHHPQVRPLRGGRTAADERGSVTGVPSDALRGTDLPALFLIAELLVGLFFGAGVIAVTTNILQAIFPILPFWPTAIVVLASAA